MQPRIEPPSEPTVGARALLAQSAKGADGQPLWLFGALSWHEELLRRFNGFGAIVRNSTVTSAAEREVVILRTAARARCELEISQHRQLAREAGVSEAAIGVCLGESDPSRLSGPEELLVRLSDELFDNEGMTPEVWRLASSHWSNAQLIEFVATAAFIRLAATLIHTFGPESDSPTGVG